MTNGAAAAAAAVSNAIKAMGPVILLEPEDFLSILRKMDRPIVVHSPSGFMTKYKYLTTYRGLYFACKSKEPVTLPVSVEAIFARKIALPDL